MKVIILSFTVFLLIAPLYAFAQAPDTLWTKNYGFGAYDEAWQIKHTHDGAFIVVGYSQGSGDIYLLKTDQNGDTLWTRMLGFLLNDIGRSVDPLDDGGYILTGYSSVDIVLMKTDSLGNYVWHQYLDNGWGRAVRETYDGSFIVAGYSPAGDSSYNLYISKTDSNGNLIWAKTYGGLNAEMAWDVREMPDSGFAVLGWTESFGEGNADIYLVRTDSNGDSLWSRTYGHIANDEGRSLLIDENGNFIIAGKITASSGYVYAAVIKVNPFGDTIWTHTYSDFDPAIANSICPTSDGGYILAGLRPDLLQTSFVMKIDNVGDPIWYTVIEDPEQNLYLRSIIQTEDGGYVAAGFHQVPNHTNDVFLVKLAPDIVGVNDEITILPERTTLHQNYPNPFNANTTISFSFAESQNINLSIYDLLGRKVEILLDGFTETGMHQIHFDASAYPSGLYFYRLEADDYSDTRMMVLLK